MFRLLTLDSEVVPEACCRREPQARDGVVLNREDCLLGQSLFINKQVRPCWGGLGAAREPWEALATSWAHAPEQGQSTAWSRLSRAPEQGWGQLVQCVPGL